ncbi:MAG: hypothetical protein WCH57_07425 [Verrucomicrobiota bacterium]
MPHWKQRETLFGEYELALSLPGRWQLRPSDSPSRWLYRSAEKHNEHVTLIREEPEEREEEAEAALRRLVIRQRRAMELAFGSGAGLTMSEPEYGEWLDVPLIVYRGEARNVEHRFEVRFFCQPRTVWILIYDAYRLTEEMAQVHAQAIFDSVVLR